MELKISKEEVTEFVDDREEIEFDVTDNLKKRYCRQKNMPIPSVFNIKECKGCYHYEMCSMIDGMAETLAMVAGDVEEIGDDLAKMIKNHEGCSYGCKHEY